jgi:hypothetical protein
MYFCHMLLHRQPESDGKVPPKKTGYKVISPNQLAIAMRGYGLHMWPTEEGRIRWRMGELESEACDQLDAVGMAMHWLSGELRDTLAELEEVRAELAMLQHMVREQECSEVS